MKYLVKGDKLLTDLLGENMELEGFHISKMPSSAKDLRDVVFVGRGAYEQAKAFGISQGSLREAPLTTNDVNLSRDIIFVVSTSGIYKVTQMMSDRLVMEAI